MSPSDDGKFSNMFCAQFISRDINKLIIIKVSSLGAV
jgi:hypothetical protein